MPSTDRMNTLQWISIDYDNYVVKGPTGLVPPGVLQSRADLTEPANWDTISQVWGASSVLSSGELGSKCGKADGTVETEKLQTATR